MKTGFCSFIKFCFWHLLLKAHSVILVVGVHLFSEKSSLIRFSRILIFFFQPKRSLSFRLNVQIEISFRQVRRHSVSNELLSSLNMSLWIGLHRRYIVCYASRSVARSFLKILCPFGFVYLTPLVRVSSGKKYFRHPCFLCSFHNSFPSRYLNNLVRSSWNSILRRRLFVVWNFLGG